MCYGTVCAGTLLMSTVIRLYLRYLFDVWHLVDVWIVVAGMHEAHRPLLSMVPCAGTVRQAERQMGNSAVRQGNSQIYTVVPVKDTG